MEDYRRSRQGKIVLAQYHGIADVDTGGSYAVKKYTSKKKINPGEVREHEEIILEPLNKKYDSIILSKVEEGEFKIIAEFVAVLKLEVASEVSYDFLS